MAFTLSGSTITQSGTDTSLAGLSGIAGVTTIANGDGNIYSFPTLLLHITGTLTVADPSKQTYIASAVRVLNGGNYTSGTFCADGVTPKTGGVHFKAVGVSVQYPRANNTGAFEVQSGGQYKFIGGMYYVSGGITYMSGATNIEEIGVTVVASRAYGTSSARIYYGTPNVSKTDVKHYDLGIDMFQKPTTTRPFQVKAFASEYVSQYVGSLNGGTDLQFIASALSNQDGTYDFDNYDAGWVELYNCASGADLKVVCQANRANHCVPLFQDINIKVTNLSGVVQNNVRYRFIDAPVSNTPTTTITTTGNLKTWDFRNTITYTGTTNASGTATVSPVLQVWHGSSNLKNLRFPSSTINPQFRGYAVETQSSSLVLGSDTPQTLSIAMATVPYLTLTEAQALALTGITFTPSGATGGTVTITGARTIAELWQYYRAWISQTANFDSEDTWTYDGTNLNIGVWTIIGIENLSSGAITTTSATAGGAFSIEVIGTVNQVTPINLTGVIVSGILVYNTNTNKTITITNCTLGTVRNDGIGMITINKVNSTITNYVDAEINFIDSSISVIGADSVTIHPTATDRDLNQNVSATFTNTYSFKYGSLVNGLTMGGTLYLRCVAGGIPFNVNKTIVMGDNVKDLGITALLSSLGTKIDNKPTLAQIEDSSVLAKKSQVEIINRNTIKASKLIPASETF